MSDSNSELVRLREELARLRRENRAIKNSTSYKLGRLAISSVKSPLGLIRLPGRLLSLWRESRARLKPPGPGTAVFEQLRKQLDDWLRDASSTNSKDVVFMFSGTTCIQGVRGNRPIRQTQALLRRGVPVLFSYHRSRFDDDLPSHQQDGLVQLPVDVTLQLLGRVAAAPLKGLSKLFVVSYPHPEILPAVELFRSNGWAVLYDCRDDWEEFSRVGMAKWFDQAVEKSLVATCHATLCVSSPLCEKMRGYSPEAEVLLSPNAVDADFVPSSYQRLPLISPPVVGYFGHLSSAWFDWDAFIEIARQRPNYRFDVIGHSAPEDLPLPDNVRLLGPVPWRALSEYVSSWSVAIIPFKMNRLSDGVDPIKIYEYLALSVPVVSFRMPQIENYPCTETVDSVADFCHALDRACLQHVDPDAIQAFLAKNTWEVRAEALLALSRRFAGARA